MGESRRYMAEILPIRLKTISNQSINQSINGKGVGSFLKFYWKIYHVIIYKYNPSWSVVGYHCQDAGIEMHDSLDKKKPHIQLQTIAGPYYIFSIIFGGYHPLDKMFISHTFYVTWRKIAYLSIMNHEVSREDFKCLALIEGVTKTRT